jgi:predicted RNA binding protein YcfA (HicA-like mRNA interferase family)
MMGRDMKSAASRSCSDMGLPRAVPGEKVIKALKALGLVECRRNGGHASMHRKSDPQEGRDPNSKNVIVPLHRKGVDVGTLGSIIREAKVSREELILALHG